MHESAGMRRLYTKMIEQPAAATSQPTLLTSRKVAKKPSVGEEKLERELLTVDPEEGETPHMYSKQSSVVASELSGNFHRELFRLYMLEADQQDRIDLACQKQKDLLAGHRDTQSRIQEVEASLRSLEDPIDSRITIKRQQIEDAQEAVKELQEEMVELAAAYERNRGKLEGQVQQWQAEVASLQAEVHSLEHDRLRVDEPPGRGTLRWLDSDAFHVAAALVIVCNMLTIFSELTHPELSFGPLNLCFLLLYQVELLLNVLHRRWDFVIGEVSVVWWNWLDIVIVASGTIEYLVGLCSGSNTQWLGGLRVLRLARLARVMKIVKLVLKSDMSWAEGPIFQTFMMVVIAFNTVLMGLEAESPDNAAWAVLENLLLLVYLFELLVRLKHHGAGFFLARSKGLLWNWLDFVIVLGGVVDSWVVPGVAAAQAPLGGPQLHRSSGLGQAMSMVRMARLARLLRLIRLVKNIPPLYTLVIGITQAMQGMGWVMLLTVSVLYICAVVGVKCVGQGWVLPSGLSEAETTEVMNTFPDIPGAFFNLFKAMNGDLESLEPLLGAVPASKYIMMGFMVVTNWAIFSILTAVMSDNMAKVTEEHAAEEREERESETRRVRSAKLEFLFRRLDTDKSGSINLGEFRELLEDEIQAEELSAITGLQASDMEDLFELIAKKHGAEQEETITHHEFVTLLNRECGQVTVRSMMKIEKALMSLQEAICK